MSTQLIERGFQKMGARVEVVERRQTRFSRQTGPTIDVKKDKKDKKGETFIINVDTLEDLENLAVTHVDPADRHLILMARDGRLKSNFLCGHDERHWFVAAIPESAPVNNVRAAKIALQPQGVREAVGKVRPKDETRRKNEAFRRQGEWFFIPLDFVPEGTPLKNEPITRGRGKPHMVEQLIRVGGHSIMDLGGGHTMTMRQWDNLSAQDRRKHDFAVQRTVPGRVFAKGTIRHSDHATIVLDDWHEIVMNTEQRARAMRSVVFMD